MGPGTPAVIVIPVLAWEVRRGAAKLGKHAHNRQAIYTVRSSWSAPSLAVSPSRFVSQSRAIQLVQTHAYIVDRTSSEGESFAAVSPAPLLPGQRSRHD